MVAWHSLHNLCSTDNWISIELDPILGVLVSIGVNLIPIPLIITCTHYNHHTGIIVKIDEK